MAHQRSWRARLRYRTDQFLSSGAGRQLLLLFVLSMLVVLLHTAVALIFSLDVGEGFGNTFWFYFTRILDAGTMGDDKGMGTRLVSTIDTVLGVIVAGLLISALSGNFQARLDAIRRGGSPVMESGHFLILGWSQKIFSVIEQLAEANIEERRLNVVVMAERDKVEMEDALRSKLAHRKKVKIVVRSGSAVSIEDLARVGFDQSRAIVVLADETDQDDPNRSDGRVIKSLLAIFNHPDVRSTAGAVDRLRVTAEVMLAENQEIAEIAAQRRASVVKTNEVISKIILQTSRISGLSSVYDELLRFAGNEVHYFTAPALVGKRFGDLLLDFPNACPIGLAKRDGSAHELNPPADRTVGADEDILVIAEDDHIVCQPYAGPHRLANQPRPEGQGKKVIEHLLILGWNEKVFPIITELENYVGEGSTVTMVCSLPEEERKQLIRQNCPQRKAVSVRHIVGEFTSRSLMEQISPTQYPTVLVLGDASRAKTSEEADTRAIIALLLLRDFRIQKKQLATPQKVCSEILEPKNRELAATTEINDIVISNEMVSMVLAQVTHEPRVRPILEDLFRSEGSEIYLKDLRLYARPGQPVTFDELALRAKARGEVAFGLQLHNLRHQNHGVVLNPRNRTAAFAPESGDRLIVLAEDDG